MFDSVDITLHPHQREWRPVRAVHRGFALTDDAEAERPHAGTPLTHADRFASQSLERRRRVWMESRCGASPACVVKPWDGCFTGLG